MEVISIKLKSKTNPNVFVATTDDGEYLLHSDVIVAKDIHRGEIDDRRFREAVADSEIVIGTGIAMKYLGSRLKTEKGVRDYLSKKGISKEAIRLIIEKLCDYSVIDDRAYAEAYVRANPKFSRLKLREKLKQAGVDRSLTEELTLELDDHDSCMSNAQKYMRGKDMSKENIDRLIRRLRGMGYGFEVINSVIRELGSEIE